MGGWFMARLAGSTFDPTVTYAIRLDGIPGHLRRLIGSAISSSEITGRIVSWL